MCLENNAMCVHTGPGNRLILTFSMSKAGRSARALGGYRGGMSPRTQAASLQGMGARPHPRLRHGLHLSFQPWGTSLGPPILPLTHQDHFC